MKVIRHLNSNDGSYRIKVAGWAYGTGIDAMSSMVEFDLKLFKNGNFKLNGFTDNKVSRKDTIDEFYKDYVGATRLAVPSNSSGLRDRYDYISWTEDLTKKFIKYLTDIDRVKLNNAFSDLVSKQSSYFTIGSGYSWIFYVKLA